MLYSCANYSFNKCLLNVNSAPGTIPEKLYTKTLGVAGTDSSLTALSKEILFTNPLLISASQPSYPLIVFESSNEFLTTSFL